MDYVVEQQFTTNEGYLALVVFHKMGHRCGYLGIPKEHQAAKDYHELPFFDIHGGLTYSNTELLDNLPDLYYLGFDCAHREDASDIDTIIKYFGATNVPYLDTEGVIRTADFVANELRSLSKQIDQIELYI